MKLLEFKTFKDLSNMTVTIADRFFLARQIVAVKSQNHLAEFDYEDRGESTQYMNTVCRAFNSLNEKERNLINNEFFFQSYHHWWETIYSKATFYRYKKKAMMKFLGAFYDA